MDGSRGGAGFAAKDLGCAGREKARTGRALDGRLWAVQTRPKIVPARLLKTRLQFFLNALNVAQTRFVGRPWISLHLLQAIGFEHGQCGAKGQALAIINGDRAAESGHSILQILSIRGGRVPSRQEADEPTA